MRPQTPYNPPPPDALKTLFVDDQIIVADKPSGLLSVPGRGPEKAICAVRLLADRHGLALTVHRLDMDTSGVMVFARNKDAQRLISQQYEKRTTQKVYEALVYGSLSGATGTIDAAIAKFSHQRPLRHLDPDGRQAITHWRVMSKLPNRTRLELKPETGRSHQLRLHLSSIGHPILGDIFYGRPDDGHRLHLHAKSLSFQHPESHDSVTFQAPTPF